MFFNLEIITRNYNSFSFRQENSMTRTLTSSILEEPMLNSSNLTDSTGISENSAPTSTDINDDPTFFEELMTPPQSLNEYSSSFDVSSQVESSTNRLQTNPKRARVTSNNAQLDNQVSPLNAIVALIENEGPNTLEVLSIVSNYFISPTQCKNVTEKLESMAANESRTLHCIIKNTTSNTRPSKERLIEMIEELNNSDLFSFQIEKRSIIVRKGIKYIVQGSN